MSSAIDRCHVNITSNVGMDFDWLLDYPDLLKICRLHQRYELLNPISFVYKPLQGVKQNGPKCGLVALAMLTNNPTENTVEKLYDRAKLDGYTHSGEMLSASHLCKLATSVLDCDVELYEGSLCDEYIKEFLLEGGCMLVPYDTDKNHSPCLSQGHKAHWAVISGAILTRDDMYVIAKQGKSLHVAIWSLKSLAESNSQLREFSPDRKDSEEEYIIPNGDIGGPLGLCNKSILIKFGGR